MNDHKHDQRHDDRYDRQIQFTAIGVEGQRQLADSQAVIVGCGALGTVVAEILARAGVGRLRLVDRDIVEWSNLQRQALFDETDARDGVTKAAAAANRLCELNSTLQIEPVVIDLNGDNIHRTLGKPDLVIDASDNFATRFLLNDWSLQQRIGWVHGGCVGASGQVRLFDGQGQPCFRCFVPRLPPAAAVETCDTAGVVGSATHLIGSLQATEAIKWLSGNRDAVRQRMVSVDLWNNRSREVDADLQRRAECPACQAGQLEFLHAGPSGHSRAAGVLCGRDAVQIDAGDSARIDLKKAAERWRGLGRVQTNRFFTRLHLEEATLTLFGDGRTVVSGTREISKARILYDRYVGG